MHTRRTYWLLFLLPVVACGAPEPSQQGTPISVFVYFHADPLDRKQALECEHAGLMACGLPDGAGFLQRVDNWEWLVDEVLGRDLQAHLELGPDTALAWSDDAGLTAALSSTAPGGQAAVQDGAVRAREGLSRWAAAGHTLGLHTHGQMNDHDLVWGTVNPDEGGPDGCAAWLKEPMTEVSDDLMEDAIFTMAWAGQGLLDQVGLDDMHFDTLSGAVPRRLVNKRLAVEDPDALDDSTTQALPPSFAPLSAGQAFSECFYRVADHPAFSPFPMHDTLALAAGDGPPVLPSVPAIGHLDERFGAESDSTAPAVLRRLLQLLVNWRYDTLVGAPPRNWMFSVGNHLFDLSDGEVGSHDALGRESFPENGNHFRSDLLAVLDGMEVLASSREWHGVQVPEGLLRWAAPSELASAEIDDEPFNYVRDDSPRPLQQWDPDAYPYLPLVAELLFHAHLACSSRAGEATAYGFMRCETGWQWGVGTAGGATCLDDQSPRWVYLFLAAEDVSIPLVTGDQALLGADVDATAMAPLGLVDAQLQVPMAGLLLETVSGGPLTVSGCP